MEGIIGTLAILGIFGIPAVSVFLLVKRSAKIEKAQRYALSFSSGATSISVAVMVFLYLLDDHHYWLWTMWIFFPFVSYYLTMWYLKNHQKDSR